MDKKNATRETQTSIKNSIATRLLKVVFGLYIIIAISVTLIHMFVEYRHQSNNIRHDLRGVQETFESAVAIGMWNLNQETLSSTLKGILSSSIVVGVEIRNSEGENVGIGGIISERDGTGNVGIHVNMLGLSQKELEVHVGEKYNYNVFTHQFPVIYKYNEKVKQIGSVTLYSSSAVVFRIVKLGFLMLIVSAVLKTAALWIIFLWMSKKILRKPLWELTKAMESISLSNLESFSVDTKTTGQNEIKVLEEGMTSMVSDLHHSVLKQKKSEELYRSLFEDNPSMYFKLSEDGIVLSVNQFGAEQLGYATGDLIGKPVLNVFFPDDKDRVLERFNDCLDNPEEVAYWEFRKVRRDGSLMWVKENVRVVEEGSGVRSVLVVCDDITSRRKAEDDLRNLQNYLANIIDSMPSSLIGVDPDGRVTQWNRETEKKTGISSDRAVCQLLEQVVPYRASTMKQVQKAMRLEEVQSITRQRRKENDKTIYENVTVYPLADKGLKGAVIRVDDVTEKVRMEEMMVQSEKMLSVGGLAAGMAHEINNPLAGMIQTADVMKNRLFNIDMEANQRVAKDLGITIDDIKAFMEKRGIFNMISNIRKSGRRVSVVVDNMLSFARKGDATVSSHNPVELMDTILELAAADYSLKKKYDFKTIEIVKEYEDNLPLLLCEGSKIQQVLLNILKNGAQAMQENIDSDDEVKPRFVLRLAREEEAGMMKIEIEDNGPGMEDSIRKRIFEPFFTTKPVGVGTGLGLSVSYFIITKNHGGTMAVKSELGQGSVFIIRLPLERKGDYIDETETVS